MSTSTKDAAEPVQPLDEPSIMPLPIQREHKTRINHPQPSWWPQSAAKRLALGKRVRDNIVSVAAQLEYNVDNNNDAHYHGAGTFLSSPSVLAIPHSSTARVVQVIGSYVKGNQRVGTWSAPTNSPSPPSSSKLRDRKMKI